MNVIKLSNLYADEAAIFNVPPDYKSDYGSEIVFIIKWLSEDHSDLKRIVENYYDAPKKNFDLLKITVDDYNDWCHRFKSEHQDDASPGSRERAPVVASPVLVKYIMQLIYNRAVLDPGKLNHYEAFSPEVYGETSYSLIEKMLQRVPLQEDDVFLDLGSGVGNVVLQVAASNKCKLCVGVEKAEWPAKYAQNMEKEFRFWMKFFGKSYSKFKLFKGDFFSEDEFIETDDDAKEGTRKLTVNSYVKEIINEAKLVFVNNYAFGAEVDHQLKLRFLDMAEGARIVSSKPFCPLNFRINDRNLNDIGSILNISEFEPLSGSVSWTPNPVSYYFHRIDRTLLEKYFFECRKGTRSSRDENKTSSSNSSNSSSSSSPPQSTSPDTNSSLSSLDDVSSNKHKPTNGKSRKRDRSYSPASIKRVKEEKTDKKKAKVSEKTGKKVKKINGGKRGASLDNEEKKTLDAMHQYVAKVSTKSPALVPTTTGGITSKTASLSLQPQPVASSSKFNKKSLTPLGDNENLESKLLKDAVVSSKLYKQVDKSLSSVDEKNGIRNGLGIGSKNDLDGLIGRRELGDDIMNAIDNHYRESRRDLIKFLIGLKSSDRFKDQLENDKMIKAEYLKKIESYEAMNKSLEKSCSELIKKRALDITGIKDVSKSPKDLMRYAKTLLNEEKDLLSQINQLNNGNHVKEPERPHLKALSKIVSSNERNQHKSVSSVDSVKSDDTQTANEHDDVDTMSTNSSSSTHSNHEHNKQAKKKQATLANSSHTTANLILSNKPYQPKPTTKSILDQVRQSVVTTNSLKSFKIPKHSVVQSSESASSVMSGDDSYARHESGSNSLESSTSATALNKSSPYYHPKKNQFRQYLIESSASTDNTTPTTSTVPTANNNNSNPTATAALS